MRRVSPIPAFLVGELVDDPVTIYLIGVQKITMNLAGLPAMSVSAGTSAEGLPLGLQVVGKPFEQGTVIKGGSVDVRERRGIRAVGGGIGIEQLSGPEAELAVVQRIWRRRSAPRRNPHIRCALFMMAKVQAELD
jgi:hypothetical protein